MVCATLYEASLFGAYRVGLCSKGNEDKLGRELVRVNPGRDEEVL